MRETELRGCAEHGGCPTDYIAVAVSACGLGFVFLGTVAIYRKRHVPEIKAKQVYLMVLQSIASAIFIVSLLMARNVFKMSRKAHGYWLSCQLWQIWLEDAGFGLLLSCHLARAYRLYHVFVGRRLPPLKSFQLLPLLIVPWIVGAAVMQGVHLFRDSNRCVAHSPWWVITGILHVSYTFMLIAATWKIRNIRFEFNEFKELMAGGSLCIVFLAVGFFLYAWNALRSNKSEDLEVSMRFLLVVVGNLVVVFFFWFPVSRPFMAQFGARQRETEISMGQALGVPPSGLLIPPTRTAFNFEEPLDCLLQNKRFRLSFLAFADRCTVTGKELVDDSLCRIVQSQEYGPQFSNRRIRLAGEAVHFYDEVRVFNRMPLSNFVGRIYMATYIIDKYIQVGARMEINISHQMRSEILNTMDLTNPNLFKRAINEAVKMMQQNLEKDYWTSPFFRELKEELDAEAEYSEQLERMSIRNFPLRRLSYDPLPSSDNPFDSGDIPAEDDEGIWMPLDDFSNCGKYDDDGNLVEPACYVLDPDAKSTYSIASSGDGSQVTEHLTPSQPSLSVESMRRPEMASFKIELEGNREQVLHRPTRSA